MNKKILITAAILGLTGILLGAFAAHGLERSLSPDAIASFQTGVRYQMYHALLLLWLGTSPVLPVKSRGAVFYLVLIGVLFFSGSIYGLSTMAVTGIDFRPVGFITPIGGLLLIGAWALLLWNFIRLQTDKS